MIDFYNAFISYKHAKLDTEIAEHVQKSLEHFHVPHKLKKGLKHEKITRIFRDKDELPITSDLTETITNALEKAEYLIVICSTNTKKSIWVKREINTFLRTHSQDKVLTVLCDGEPDQVIPEELLSMNKQFVDANGITQTVRVPVEPLSCDYRLPRRRADREELPRLASAILGCSYDELQRRRRQYMIRRAAAIVAVAFAGLAAFGAYMTYSRKQIDNSLIDSLRSRSVYYANESTQLLKDGKRVDAVHLALAALPNENTEKMPVTADAIKAITEATGAYKSNHGASYTATWNYRTDHAIKKCILSEDNERIAAMDESGNAYCWEAATRELLFKKLGENTPVDIVFFGKDTLGIVYREHLDAYNIETGKQIWSFTVEDMYLSQDSVQYNSNYVYLFISNSTVDKLSVKDGSVKDQYEVEPNTLFKNDMLTVSPDGKKLAYVDDVFIDDDNDQVHIYDTETGKLYSRYIDSSFVSMLTFIDNEHLCAITIDDLKKNSSQYTTEIKYIKTNYMEFHCFDSTMTNSWTNQLEYNDISPRSDAVCLSSKNEVLFYSGNVAGIYDINTGDVKHTYKMNSTIVTAADPAGTGAPQLICKNGDYIIVLNDDTDDMIAYNFLCKNIEMGMIGGSIYAIPEDGMDIISYNPFLQDDEWEGVDAPGDYSFGSNFQCSATYDDYLIVASSISDSEIIRVSVIDMNESEVVFWEDVPKEGILTSNFTIEIQDEVIYGCFGDYVYTIDIDRERVDKIDIVLAFPTIVVDGKIYKSKISDMTLTLEVSDMDGSNYKTFETKVDEDISWSYVDNIIYVENIDSAFLTVKNKLFVADMKKEKLSEVKLPSGWMTDNSNLYVTSSDDGSQILISDGFTILVTDKSYKEQYTSRCNGTHRLGAIFRNGILYVAEDDYLMLLKGDTGELINLYEMSLFCSGEAKFTFYDDTHQLFIQTKEQLSIFDTYSWIEIANIENILCYHEKTDRFYVYSYHVSTDCELGYIRRYTISDLIKKAERYLNGHELDDVTKSKYGL